MSAKPPIVLIHGLWMTPSSWDTWADKFRDLGHDVLAPAWPGLGKRMPADIRRDPSALRGLGIKEIVDSYDTVIRSLAEAPIIMGHSFGGLFAQLLADRGLGTSIVGVAPAQPAGITTLPGTTIRSGFPILRNPFASKAATPLTKAHFHYTFGNDLTRAESDVLWEDEAIPSSNRVFFQGAGGAFAGKDYVSRVDWKKPDRAPLLMISGGADHVVPAVIAKAMLAKYKTGPSLVEFREYPGRTHRTITQDGWEPIADAALEWALAHRK